MFNLKSNSFFALDLNLSYVLWHRKMSEYYIAHRFSQSGIRLMEKMCMKCRNTSSEKGRFLFNYDGDVVKMSSSYVDCGNAFFFPLNTIIAKVTPIIIIVHIMFRLEGYNCYHE